MRLLALLLLASVASGAVVVHRSWTIQSDSSNTLARVSEEGDGVSLMTYTGRFEERKLTKTEAAELGRALLEAAGEQEKPAGIPSCGYLRVEPTNELLYYENNLVLPNTIGTGDSK